MFVRRKVNRSGSSSIVIVEKSNGKYNYIHTIGTSNDESEIKLLLKEGGKWINEHKDRLNPRIDFSSAEEDIVLNEEQQLDLLIGNIDKALINGVQLILNNVFNSIGFNAIEDDIFRHLVFSRLAFPSSKLATVDYLKSYFDEDVSLHQLYRYLDKLNLKHKDLIQEISVKHTMNLFGGNIGVMFYDVTTLYFESDYEDELRKTGFSKEGRHSNPQIILGLLVSLDGYPLAYTIHEGNKYEGHTMLPVIQEFVKRFSLEDFIVVADSGLMNTANLTELETLGYKYIIGARIKNMDKSTQEWILSQPKRDKEMVVHSYENGRRLLVGYTDDRAKKDAYNRNKGIKRLEKSYHRGQFTKSNLNRKGYNKFLEMKDSVKVTINYDKIDEDARWDGLKGYLTNTKIPTEQVYAAYHNLWNVEKAFRIAKSKIEIRPMFHFTRKRIEAHICICFVALKVYKELERIAKTKNIKLSVDKILDIAKTIITLKIKLPNSNKMIYRTLLTTNKHHQIAILLDNDFWVSQNQPLNQTVISF